MPWLFLVLAGLFEVGFAVSLKLTNGFTRLVPILVFAFFAVGSFVLFNLALRSLPVGTAYAVWTGIGTAGAAAVGILFMADPVSLLRIVSIGAIVFGVVGLNLAGSALR
jgi:quaternary ammonium compound-resistance protein SugE